MKRFAKELRGYHHRLGDLIGSLESKGYKLPFEIEKMDGFFRNSAPGKNSTVWSDENGNIIVVEYVVEAFNDDILDSLLTIVDANYIDITILSSEIKDYLKK
ncbi:hypothetical protein Q5O24_06305 [Eubacteriaceae bacterium ES3]|nr:hypothetical protein Q5O24_06305 [Eubacteriaceae bacterium ES3]